MDNKCHRPLSLFKKKIHESSPTIRTEIIVNFTKKKSNLFKLICLRSACSFGLCEQHSGIWGCQYICTQPRKILEL